MSAMASPPLSPSPLPAPALSFLGQELHSDSTTPMQHQNLPSLPQNSAVTSQVKVVPLEPSAAPINPCQQQEESQDSREDQFLQSIGRLTNLSSVINEFCRRFDELRKHLDFIQTSIDTRYNELQQQPSQIHSTPAIAPPSISNPSAEQPRTDAAITTADAAAIMPATISSPPKSGLMALCEMMCGRGLRKYLISHLSNIGELRAEVPSALQRASQPAKLVLDCIGRFYLQGIRAYNKNSPLIPVRKASILILELFLLTMDKDIQLDSAVKQEADQAAIAWRKRLMAEGGLSKACEDDAKGLLLFVGCYGVPKVFSNENIWDLVRLSNSRQIADALRRSHVLVKRISDILERMMNNAVKIEAVDIASTFGIEDKFPPQKILTSYLRDSREALKRRKREANNSPLSLKEASERHLASLKSVMKFLEDRKLDPNKLLSGWKIREKIEELENDVINLNKKIDEKVAAKRKADENEFLNNLKNQEAKRPKFTGSNVVSSPSLGLHGQRALFQVDSNGLYNAPMGLNFPDVGVSVHSNSPLLGSIMRGSNSFLAPSIMHGSTSASVMHGSSSFAAAYGVPSASSYAGGGQKVGGSGLSYGWHGVRDGSVIDGSVRQSFVQQPASGVFAPSAAAVEGFAGLPNPSTTPNGSSTSDLYRFADAVK